MQSLKTILEDMGFNKDAPLEAQKAFLKHLVTAANQTRPTSVAPRTPQNTPKNPPQVSSAPTSMDAATGTQLEFDLTEGKRVS